MAAAESSSHFHAPRADFVAHMLRGVEASQHVHVLQTEQGSAVIDAGHRPEERVAVISGGGSGHEPAHAGYVGAGMLTAAVPGDVFASPPVSAVLQAIRAVTGDRGCVLIIKNYTGDRLNFGLAAERARAEGYTVETVLVADDVALPDVSQPRGLAGTVLVHKLAGHMASEGADAETIARAAQAAADGLRTIGLALGPADVPGDDRGGDPARQAELGLGIHNEPGAQAVTVAGAADAMEQVLDALGLGQEPVPASGATAVDHEKGELVVMLNDLGGCSAQEGLILAGELEQRIGARRIGRLLGPHRFMTSLDMHGFSVTTAPLSPELAAALDAPTAAPGWRAPVDPGADSALPDAFTAAQLGAQPEDSAQSLPASDDGEIESRVLTACRALLDASDRLDELDRLTGDGDAGSTFGAGAGAVIAAIEKGRLGFAEPDRAVQEVARLLEERMGGSSGVLLAILCAAAAQELSRAAGRTTSEETAPEETAPQVTTSPVTVSQWAVAFGLGIEAVQLHGGAAEGDRTMLDALIPARRALERTASLVEAATAASGGAAGTADLTARAGRAAYVPAEAQSGNEDAGAVAVALFLEALAEGSR